MDVKLDEFRHREGREPSPKERAALEREASADTRGRKSGLGVADLATRWQGEAAEVGWTVERLVEDVQRAAADRSPTDSLTVTDVVEAVSSQHSSWGRPDVIQAICDLQRPVSQMSGHRWAAAIEHAADKVLERCVDLDPPDATQRRDSDGRSLWIEPTAPRFTSEAVLVQEERILTWAIDAQADPASPSSDRRSQPVSMCCRPRRQRRWPATTVSCWWSARPVPARPGCSPPPSTTCTPTIVPVFGVAPTAKAARVLERDTGMRADTVAKLLHEWQRPDRPPLPEYRLGAGTTRRRRRGRDVVHPGVASARHPRRGEPVAPRARRRPSPAASRRPWRPVRRAVRQRPSRRTRTPPPLHPRLGGCRVAATAIR